jgi:inosine/xanthosine triphosphate pyrophosphatase family protein
MKYKKIYLASSNKQKLERLKKLFTKIDKDVIVETYPDLIDIEET